MRESGIPLFSSSRFTLQCLHTLGGFQPQALLHSGSCFCGHGNDANARWTRRFYVRHAHAMSSDFRFRSFYLESLDETHFHEYTRLMPAVFAELHSRIAPRQQHAERHRAPCASMHRIAITLRFLGHGMPFVATAHELELGRTAV